MRLIKTVINGEQLFINLDQITTLGFQKMENGDTEMVMFNQVGYAVRLVCGKDIANEEVNRIKSFLTECCVDRVSGSDEAPCRA